MVQPGEQRPATTSPPPLQPRRANWWQRLLPRSLGGAVAGALLVGLLAAITWALLKGILETPGALVVAVAGGWAIGALTWQVGASRWLAVAVAMGAWLLGLSLTWLLAMALLPGSSRTFLERLGNTPFLDWLAPQFGFLDVLGLVLYLVGALYGARSRS